jgi:F-type H+-transporting ATPase subunit b
MDIIPDLWPAIALTLPFAFAYVCLRFILFTPLHDFLEERDGISAKALADAEEMHQAANDKVQQLNDKLAAARSEAGDLRNAARARAHDEETEILAAARAESDKKVEAAVAKIADEKKVAATTLRGTAKVLSGEIASQILSA